MYTPAVTAKETGSPAHNTSGGAGKVLGIGFLTITLALKVVVLVALLGNDSSSGGQDAVSDEERQAS